MQTNDQILVLIAPVEMKDDLVDVLMEIDFISGFSLSLIDGYSREHSHYDINEQVEGYRKFYRFEVLHRQQEQEKVLTSLKKDCSNGSVRYWILPVINEGRF